MKKYIILGTLLIVSVGFNVFLLIREENKTIEFQSDTFHFTIPHYPMDFKISRNGEAPALGTNTDGKAEISRGSAIVEYWTPGKDKTATDPAYKLDIKKKM